MGASASLSEQFHDLHGNFTSRCGKRVSGVSNSPNYPAAEAARLDACACTPQNGSSTGVASNPHSGCDSCRDTSRAANKDLDRKSTRLNSSDPSISYAVFCLKKKNNEVNL